MNDRTTHRRRIKPGQTELHRLARGSRITAVTGTLRVEAPAQWLAETMLRAVSTACPGVPVVVPCTGWVMLSSEAGAEILIEPALAAPDSALAALRALAHHLRRRIRAASSPSHAV
jgi:hypothetical protein